MIAADPQDHNGHVWVPQNAAFVPLQYLKEPPRGLVMCGVRRCLLCARLFPYNRKPERCEGLWHIQTCNDNWPKRNPTG